MVNIKTFEARSLRSLERELNSWFATNRAVDILNIQYQMTNSVSNGYTALVTYNTTAMYMPVKEDEEIEENDEQNC